jgi:hypothetical protein
MTLNFLDKFDSTNKTAWALTENGLSFVAAQNLHCLDKPIRSLEDFSRYSSLTPEDLAQS